ncbi:Glutamyl-tRNA reductase [bacterium HR09]|nr:Glutamyl-tRNA reductase [bacterium HR09]
MNTLFALGTNHRLATPEEVAQARIPEHLLPDALHAIAQRLNASELVYLATCHRTEFYVVHEGDLCPGRLTQALRQALAELTGGVASLPESSRCLLLQGASVAQHLFRVSAALDSLMLGESQILGQVKEAFRQSAQAGLAKAKLHTLFGQAFRAAKRVRTETRLSQGATSLVSLARNIIRERLSQDSRPVAIVGAGEMAAAAGSLVRKLDGTRDIVIFNRSRERGQALAQQLGASFQPLSNLFEASNGFSVVVLAVASEEPVLSQAVAARLAPALIVDLGLPANAAPECAALPGITLVNQTTLHAESEANRQARAAEVARAEAIIREQLEELGQELLEHNLAPVAKALRQAFYQSARCELQQAFSNGHGTLPQEFLDELAERLAQRLVRTPMKGLREVAFTHSLQALDTFLSAVSGEHA